MLCLPSEQQIVMVTRDGNTRDGNTRDGETRDGETRDGETRDGETRGGETRWRNQMVKPEGENRETRG